MIPKMQEKKNSPDSDFSIPYIEKPVQFSIQSVFQQQGKIEMSAFSKKEGKLFVNLYRVLNPMLFLKSIKDFSAFMIKAEISKSLVLAKGQSPDYWQKEASKDKEYGDFILEYQKTFWVKDQEKLSLLEFPAVSEGLYLIEAWLESQVVYLPLLVSSLRSFSWNSQEKKYVFLTQSIPQDAFFLYSGGENSWEKIRQEEGFFSLKNTQANLEWFLIWSDAFIHCLPIESRKGFFQQKLDLTGKPEKEYIDITGNRRIFSLGDIVDCTLWGCEENSPEEVSLLYKKNEGEAWHVLDRQRRVTAKGKAQFFFPLEKYGMYLLQARKARRLLYVPEKNSLTQMIPGMYFWEKERSIEIFLPGKKGRQCLFLSQQEELLEKQSIEAFEGDYRFSFSLKNAQEGHFLCVQNCYEENGKILYEEWQIPPISSSTKQERLPIPDVAGKQEFPGILLHAKSQNHEKLYKIWAKEKIFLDYSQAFRSYSQEKYRDTMGLCLDILYISPDHKDSMSLLLQAEKKFSFSSFSFSSPTFLLEHFLPEETKEGITFGDWIEELSLQSNVDIEIEPMVWEKIPAGLKTIEKLPQKENALSLLQYVLAKRNLTFKIEHGVLIIICHNYDAK